MRAATSAAQPRIPAPSAACRQQATARRAAIHSLWRSCHRRRAAPTARPRHVRIALSRHATAAARSAATPPHERHALASSRCAQPASARRILPLILRHASSLRHAGATAAAAHAAPAWRSAAAAWTRGFQRPKARDRWRWRQRPTARRAEASASRRASCTAFQVRQPRPCARVSARPAQIQTGTAFACASAAAPVAHVRSARAVRSWRMQRTHARARTTLRCSAAQRRKAREMPLRMRRRASSALAVPLQLH